MRKTILLILFLVSTVITFSQPPVDRARSTGATIGQYLGYLVVPVVLIAGIAILVRRLKK